LLTNAEGNDEKEMTPRMKEEEEEEEGKGTKYRAFSLLYRVKTFMKKRNAFGEQ